LLLLAALFVTVGVVQRRRQRVTAAGRGVAADPNARKRRLAVLRQRARDRAAERAREQA
jgi:hypothetical protein